ncbi:hypothetical protein TI39_contig4219g00004 [Zymoseptoria brevis]|uniref:Uncharacterized protein n=1 Tax=Zymoseptoria brevis TaxID=1047168 RepID=A0A0F4G9L8_9PEZI|nr:hypothetical protein TI39_contig4219g00004 [Zymoseptoria brevis]
MKCPLTILHTCQLTCNPKTPAYSKMEKVSPPPYSNGSQGPSQDPAAVAADALLGRLVERVNEDFVQDYPPEAQGIVDQETKRIRNMLEFTLAVDYQGYSSTSLSAADREHFMHMNKATGQLRSTLVLQRARPSREVRPNPAERQVLAAYFWKYLFEPCKALSLPVDFVYSSINALSRYIDGNGCYEGSTFGILQQYRVEQLAGKLYRDRHVVIPLIFTEYTARNRMLNGVNAIEELYFISIDGVEGSTLPNTTSRNFQTAWSVKYEANERGVAYASTRKAAIARACKELSTKYWSKAVQSCVAGVLARFKRVKEGKREPDFSKATWRGEDTKLPLTRRPMDASAPGAWWRLCSFHIPDYCEFRDQVLMNDC